MWHPVVPHLHIVNLNRTEDQTIKSLRVPTDARGLRLELHSGPEDVQWNGQYLVAGYGSGEVLIFDFCDMCPQ